MQKRTEKIAGNIFRVFGLLAVVSVVAITVYMFMKGAPAIIKVGVPKLLFSSVWKPTAAEPSYGIAYVILSSIVGTFGAILLGVPIGVLTAVFLTDFTNDNKVGRTISKVLASAVELLAAIPSVIYGLIGMLVLNPFMYEIEKKMFSGSETHQFTGGSNLLAAIIVLAIMILPTVINISVSSIRAVSKNLRAASIALGASKIQTIFKVVLPAARSGIMTGVVLGIGRALGEAMAINMVAGGTVNIPLPFNSVKFLTTQLVSEMSYSSGLHRQVLFTVGLVLYIFIVLINFLLTQMKKKGEQKYAE